MSNDNIFDDTNDLEPSTPVINSHTRTNPKDPNEVLLGDDEVGGEELGEEDTNVTFGWSYTPDEENYE